MTKKRVAVTILATILFGAVPSPARAQAPAGVGASPPTATVKSPSTSHVQPGQSYTRPTHAQKFRNYIFDSFGLYAIIYSAASAGINQASGDRINGGGSGTPPEWGGGTGPYFERFASNLGINLIATTTRYGLAELFHEDTIFYRCDCSGIMPRLGHALISTVTARRGDDGHRTFSFSNLVAPYAGAMTGVLVWYPDRYEPMDGFRTGNYKLMTTAAVNVAKEFIYGGPHTLMARTPLKHVTGSDKDSNH